MSTANTLGKSSRIKSRKQIDLLFKSGKRMGVGPFRVNFLLEKTKPAGIDGQAPGMGPAEPIRTRERLQVGVGAASRNFKRAVDRNRIKRLMREAWRLNRQELEQELEAGHHSLSVFIIYSAKELPTQAMITEHMRALIVKLRDLR